MYFSFRNLLVERESTWSCALSPCISPGNLKYSQSLVLVRFPKIYFPRQAGKRTPIIVKNPKCLDLVGYDMVLSISTFLHFLMQSKKIQTGNPCFCRSCRGGARASPPERLFRQLFFLFLLNRLFLCVVLDGHPHTPSSKTSRNIGLGFVVWFPLVLLFFCGWWMGLCCG